MPPLQSIPAFNLSRDYSNLCNAFEDDLTIIRLLYPPANCFNTQQAYIFTRGMEYQKIAKINDMNIF